MALPKSAKNIWCPTYFMRSEAVNDGCSTKVAIIQTDAGRAYLKALGNPMGPHALAREWIGTSVARWFGLTTFDFAIIQLDSGLDVALGAGHKAEPGSAFVTRAEPGGPWSGLAETLADLVNPEDITRLAIMDTWVLNPDRFPPPQLNRGPNPDNVFLSVEGLSGKACRVVAMDFSDCLNIGGELNARIADIKHWQNDHLYGMFPNFARFFSRQAYEDCLSKLARVTKADMAEIVNRIPPDWDVPEEVRNRIADFLVARAHYLVEQLPVLFRPYLGVQDDLPELE